MKTDDMMRQLAAELTPVRRLQPPGKRAALWLAGSVLYLGALAFGMSRLGAATGGTNQSLLLSQSVGLLAGALAVVAAFFSVVPGRSNRVLIGAALATLAWLGWFVLGAIGAGDARSMALSASREWGCVAIILVGSAPLIGAMSVMLKRGAPLTPTFTGFLVAMGAGLLANFGACISLPHESIGAALAWHGGALAFLALCGALVGRFVFTWR